jgi:acetyl-CoA carboxylase biotin carboxylase subunit
MMSKRRPAAVTKVLVANRGEIALRIVRTLRELGLESVAVYSEADAGAPHVPLATQAVCVGPPAVSESYLNIETILEAALQTGADAVHPGYGLLSENPAFAEAVTKAGMTWIGPPIDAMNIMASKTHARAAMAKAGVPVVPGGTVEEAQSIGFPLLIKASAGGGGKGMRRVDTADEWTDALAACRREAAKAFGDDTVYLERCIERPRHVEIQVLADTHGTVVHLFERECSVQRRHQKVVEESPCVALSESQRTQMGDMAVAAAQSVGYVGAGTVEFLVDPEGAFYFLEMNTRLQVEHPVTEMVVGLDLVAEQIRIAQGEKLGYVQGDLRQRGHAIECRIYAEDPVSHLPQTGVIQTLIVPEGPGIRHDSGICTGWEVGVHYDPLLAKLCAWGPSREMAIARLRRALDEYIVVGVQTNLDLLRHVVGHPEFAAGNTTTAFLDEHSYERPPVPDVAFIARALADLVVSEPNGSATNTDHYGDAHSPWKRLGGWRL